MLFYTLFEGSLLFLHFLGQLLAHGLAQDVGLPPPVPGQLDRDLQYLLLVDQNSVGVCEDRLEVGVEVGNGLEAVLAPGVLVDVAHGAGPVESHRRHDVRELVRLHVAQDLAHAAALQLENAARLTRGEKLVDARIVEGDLVRLDHVAPDLLHILDSALDQRQRGEAQDIHLE